MDRNNFIDIIKEFRCNSRINMKEIASKYSVSNSTICWRKKWVEQVCIIERYCSIIEPSYLRCNCQCLIIFKGKIDDTEIFIPEINSLSQASSSISGNVFVLECFFRMTADLQDYLKLLRQKGRVLKCINIKSIVMKESFIPE